MNGNLHPTTAASAPGKVLLAGGYLVLDRAYTGFVFGLSARINVIATEIHTSPGVQLTEIAVDSPQFVEAGWRYGYRLALDDGGILVTQLHVGPSINRNRFVETTLSYVLTYISRVGKHRPSHSMTPCRLIILADNDFYSHPDGGEPPAGEGTAAGPRPRFAHFPTRLEDTHKTGLGSSATLVTALTAALLTHYLPTTLFDVSSVQGKAVLHNLAQAAHCAAQGKVGSGFDVAAAVYGSSRYRRFSPSVLAGLPEVGAAGFATALAGMVEDQERWDTEVDKAGVGGVPRGLALRMCDVDCGSQTVSMVKKVLAWREADAQGSRELWDELQGRNEALARALQEARLDDLGPAIGSVRELVRKMGEASGVPIEPPAQTELLDRISAVEGVYGGVVPGAGGFDALAILMKDDEDTVARVEAALEECSRKAGGKIRLLGVRGEMDGVRLEELAIYDGWLS